MPASDQSPAAHRGTVCFEASIAEAVAASASVFLAGERSNPLQRPADQSTTSASVWQATKPTATAADTETTRTKSDDETSFGSGLFRRLLAPVECRLETARSTVRIALRKDKRFRSCGNRDINRDADSPIRSMQVCRR